MDSNLVILFFKLEVILSFSNGIGNSNSKDPYKMNFCCYNKKS